MAVETSAQWARRILPDVIAGAPVDRSSTPTSSGCGSDDDNCATVWINFDTLWNVLLREVKNASLPIVEARISELSAECGTMYEPSEPRELVVLRILSFLSESQLRVNPFTVPLHPGRPSLFNGSVVFSSDCRVFGFHCARLLSCERVVCGLWWNCSNCGERSSITWPPASTGFIQQHAAIHSHRTSTQPYVSANARRALPDRRGSSHTYGSQRTNCKRCGSAFDEPQPLWGARIHCVLRDGSGDRFAAVISACIDPMRSCFDRTAIPRLGDYLRVVGFKRRAGVDATGTALVCVHDSVDLRSAHSSCLRSMISGRHSFAPYGATGGNGDTCTFEELVHRFVPQIVGQFECKLLLTLTTLHALYAAEREPSVRKLHVLVTGPPRCGKSSLLSQCAAALGNHAEQVRGVRSSVSKGRLQRPAVLRTVADAMPTISPDGNMRLAGTAATCETLTVDPLAQVDSLVLLEDILRASNTVLPDPSGHAHAIALANVGGNPSLFTCATVVVRCQVVASMSDTESPALIARALDVFSLIAGARQHLSVDESAAVSREAVETSISRSWSQKDSSCSQQTRSSSIASNTFGAASPQVSISGSIRLHSGAVSDAAVAHQQLSALVHRSPSLSELNSLIPRDEFTSFFLAKLSEERFILPESVCLAEHLSVLWELCIARLIATLSATPAMVGCTWASVVLQDVWGAYMHHLHSRHRLLSASGTSTTVCKRPGIGNVSLGLPTAQDNMMTSANGRKRGSKRMRTYEFVQDLWDSQESGVEAVGDCDSWGREGEAAFPPQGGGSEACVSLTVAQSLYESYGGKNTFGAPFAVTMDRLMEDGVLIRVAGGFRVLAPM